MGSERQYNEQEIAAIFKHAAQDQESAQRQVSHSGGLTLAEMEQIGQEAGIMPEFIARAAVGLDRAALAPPPTTCLGLTISVVRTVDLPGTFSGEDWDRLVADLHQIFEVPGKVRRDGSLRQWQNDSLHVLVEPTASGHRLHLRTVNDILRGGLLGGLVFLVMGLFFTLIVATKGDVVSLAKLLFVSMFSFAGLGSMGSSAYRLPRWRKEQSRRMEAVVARALERSAARPTTAAEVPAPVGRPVLDLPADTDLTEVAQPRVEGRSRS